MKKYSRSWLWCLKHPEKTKIFKHNYYIKHKKEILEKHKKYYSKNKERLDKYNKKWKKDNKNKTKIYWLKHQHIRKRNLGFNLIYYNIIDEIYVYHHINDNDVVCIPIDLHELYSGRNLDEHHFMCNEIIKQIYRDD